METQGSKGHKTYSIKLLLESSIFVTSSTWQKNELIRISAFTFNPFFVQKEASKLTLLIFTLQLNSAGKTLD